MGARGPRKKLASLDRLDGNPSNRELPDFGIEATGAVFIPEHLHEDAQACIEVITSSMPAATYAAVDSYLLSAFATSWMLHRRFAHMVSDPDFKNTLVNSAGSEYANPVVALLNKQAQIMASLGDRLGLDPKARQALKLPSEQPKSKFDGLLGGRDHGASRSH